MNQQIEMESDETNAVEGVNLLSFTVLL